MTKLVEAPRFNIKKTAEFQVGSVATRVERRPFGMRPQEVASSSAEATTVYDPKAQRTDIDFSKSFKQVLAKTDVQSITSGKIDDVNE